MQALYTTIKKQAEGGNFPNLTTFTIYNKSILMNAYDIMQRPNYQIFLKTVCYFDDNYIFSCHYCY